MEFVIKVYGHKNIRATHKSTLEITKDNYLTKRGDCIIGIKASHSASDLPNDLKEYLLNGNKIEIIIKVDDIIDKFYAYGHKNLIFSDKNSIVIRKSTYIDSRTIAINSEKSAIDIERKVIEKIREEKEFSFIIRY